MQKICFIIYTFFLLFATNASQAESLYVRHATGGQASALVVGNGYWYQSLGEKLLVLKKNGGELIATVPLAGKGTAHCTDLCIVENRMYALLDGSEVVEIDLRQPAAPNLGRRIAVEELGIVPRQFGTVSNFPVVFGEGGVVRLGDEKKLIDCSDLVTGVATTSSFGVVFASDNKLFGGESNELLGIATCIYELDEGANANSGTLVYARDLGEVTEVGLMTSALMPVGTLGKEILDGELETMYVRGSRVYVATSAGVYVLGVSPKEFRLLRTFAIEGVKDIDIVSSNYFALCGKFGRGLYRIDDDRGGEGESLFRVVPANNSMSAGVFDTRGVQVSTELGSLYYVFGEELVASDLSFEEVLAPTTAVVLGADAAIDEFGAVTLLTSDAEMEVTLPSPATTVIAVGGNFWFGAEDGIYMVGQREDEQILLGLQLAGPIVQLIPLLDGSVGFVSGAGVVGVVSKH